MDPFVLANYLRRARPQFERFRNALDFVEAVDAIVKTVDSEFYFNRNEAKWLREAWVLARYIELEMPVRVRLVSQDPPDALVEMGARNVPIEITEVIDPKRARGREYRSAAVHEWPRSDPTDAPDLIPKLLAERIVAKAKNQIYGPGTILLVNLNMNDHTSRHDDTKANIQAITSRKHGNFERVRVLWERALY